MTSTMKFDEQTAYTDVVLELDGQRLYVNSGILAMASPVFDKMFTSDFKEKSQKKVSLPGKKAKDMCLLLECLHPCDHYMKITEKNVRPITPLAHEYQMNKVLAACEAFLLKHSPLDISDLNLADIYDLKRLKLKCVNHLAGTRLETDEQRNSLRTETRFLLYEARMTKLTTMSDALQCLVALLSDVREVPTCSDCQEQLSSYCTGCGAQDKDACQCIRRPARHMGYRGTGMNPTNTWVMTCPSCGRQGEEVQDGQLPNNTQLVASFKDVLKPWMKAEK